MRFVSSIEECQTCRRRAYPRAPHIEEGLSTLPTLLEVLDLFLSVGVGDGAPSYSFDIPGGEILFAPILSC